MKETYLAAAKINLTLDILGRREDGYHLMKMVMQSVSLFDRVTLDVRPGESGIALKCGAAGVPEDSRNLAWRAAEKFLAAAGKSAAVRIDIEKRIPSQAGMAGGSADAAAVLTGMNELLHFPLPEEELYRIGLSLGADVPFCMAGGTRLAEGIGERLSPLPPLPECFFVIAKPPEGVATGPCFQRYDSLAVPPERPDADGMAAALERKDLPGILGRMKNVLEPAAECPAVNALREKMAEYHPLGCAMTGSGSAVAAAFDTLSGAEKCRKGLLSLQKEGTNIFLVLPVPYGVCREKVLGSTEGIINTTMPVNKGEKINHADTTPALL